MKVKYLIVFFIIILAAGCNTKSDNGKDKVENKKVKSLPELTVRMGFKTSVEDQFAINLNDIIVDEFQKMKIQVNESVPVSSTFESIEGKFGPEKISNHLVISLGNKFEKKIEFNAIELSYGNNVFLITESNFKKFFRTNKYVEFDSINYSFKTKIIDGKHNPALIARRNLMTALKKD